MATILALVLAAQPCLDQARALDAISKHGGPVSDLRDAAVVAVGMARAQAGARVAPQTNLAPVFDGFARRLREAEDAEVRNEIADVGESLAEACRRAEAPVLGNPAPVHPGRLNTILQRPEFDLQDEPMGALDRVWRWLRKIFLSLLEARGTATYAEAGRYLILVLGAGFALFVAFRVARATRARPASARPLRSAGGTALDDPAEHLARARRAEETGRHREAVREQMLAVLSSLERRRFALPGRAHTNREIAGEAMAHGAPSAVATQLVELADWYDRTWYGLAEVSAADSARFAERAERLRTTIRVGP